MAAVTTEQSLLNNLTFIQAIYISLGTYIDKTCFLNVSSQTNGKKKAKIVMYKTWNKSSCSIYSAP